MKSKQIEFNLPESGHTHEKLGTQQAGDTYYPIELNRGLMSNAGFFGSIVLSQTVGRWYGISLYQSTNTLGQVWNFCLNRDTSQSVMDYQGMYNRSAGSWSWRFINGTLNCLAVTETSDFRRKRNVEHIPPGQGLLAGLKNLRPAKFSFDGPDQSTRYGLIAQEVQQVFPETVKAIPDDPDDPNGATTLAIDRGQLNTILIQSIIELTQKVEALESRIQVLERKPN